MIGPQAEQEIEEIDLSTELAVERTHAANERTLMAWIRTALSLITFGFSVYKIFQLEMVGAMRGSWMGPRGFGAAMILIGLVSLILGIMSHNHSEGLLRRRYPYVPWSSARVVALLVAILGIGGLVMTVLRK